MGEPEAQVEQAPDAPDAVNDATTQGLSKTQLKKLRKKQQLEEKKLWKKAEKKRKKAEQSALRREEHQLRKQTLTEEELQERNKLKEQRIAIQRKEKEEKKAKQRKALETGQTIVIDLEFEEFMSEGELKSLCQQLTYCQSANAKAAVPAHLILTGVQGRMKEVAERQISGLERWPAATISPESYIKKFEGSKDDLVYLTADSSNELQELDPKKAYIVGGIVDRNRHKNICYNKALDHGIATAKLPIGEYLQLTSSNVMCTNHVVEIMLKWLDLKDWKLAFEAVVPSRKRKGPEGDNDTGEADNENAVIEQKADEATNETDSPKLNS